MKRMIGLSLFLSVSIALADLDAGAGCTGGRIFVQNKSKDHWFQVKIELNRDYSHTAEVVPAKTVLRFLPGVFTKSDGTRFDLERTACKTIDIHATVDGKRDHWNGAYK